MYDLIALVFVILVNLSLGLLVLSRNSKSRINIIYALLTLSVIFWSSANYATNHVHQYSLQLYVNRLSFSAAVVMVLLVWYFSIYFPKKLEEHAYQKRIALGVTIVALALAVSSYVVRSVTYDSHRQVTNVTTGSLYLIYVACVIVFFIFLVRNLFVAYKNSRSDLISRQQVLYTGYGILLSFLWLLVTSAVLPLALNSWAVSKLGIVGSLFFVGFIGAAIIKHKLFDIRLIVARSLAYLLLLSSIVGGYSLIIYVVTARLFGSSHTFVSQVVPILAAIFVAVTYQRLSRFFNRITNQYFYRDAYEPQLFLDQLNRVLVSTIIIEDLLTSAAKVIEENLKPIYCQFLIRETSSTKERVIGNSATPLSPEEFNLAFTEAKILRKKIIITDELEEKDEVLHKYLSKNEIAAVVPLISSTSNVKKRVGYIVLGAKKSGNLYNGQDVRILEIISNELVIAIQNALRYEEIQSFNVTLQDKVDKATYQLRKANSRLKQLDETKDDFISMASHQLRTPLTSMKGYVSMVIEGDAGKISKNQKELLEQAFVSSQRMVNLIADLLNISRLKTGKFVIDAAPTNLAEMIGEEISQLKESAKAHGLELNYEPPEHFPALMLDTTKTRQVIMNFIDNAIYYTPKGGHITVQLGDKPESVEFTVTDDGIGVPKAEQHHLFSKFYRANNAKKARPDGTGLGLFMAKKVIVAEGGGLIFKSEEGKGSTFGFTFPKTALAPKSKTKVPEPARA